MAVIQFLIISPLGAGNLRVEGKVVSSHRTLTGAVRKLAAMQRACRRAHGRDTYLDRSIVVTDDGDVTRRSLTALEREFASEVES